jgi:hypothetical protein
MKGQFTRAMYAIALDPAEGGESEPLEEPGCLPRAERFAIPPDFHRAPHWLVPDGGHA